MTRGYRRVLFGRNRLSQREGHSGGVQTARFVNWMVEKVWQAAVRYARIHLAETFPVLGGLPLNGRTRQ